MAYPYEDISNKIAHLAKLHFKSIHDFAKQSNVPYTTLTSILHRNSAPSLKNLYKICICLNISISDLLEETEPEIVITDTQTKQLIKIYNSLPENKKDKLFAYLQGLCD